MHHKPLIIANWKMNLTKSTSAAFCHQLNLHADFSAEVIICPPYGLIDSVKDSITNAFVAIGGQDCSANGNFGPYTGEVSAFMLKDLGCSYVIIGHSERRTHQHEDNAMLAKKIQQAHEANLVVIFCVGETLAEKNIGFEVIDKQLEALPASAHSANTIIAYEPVYAIGSGVACELPDIAQTHECIDNLLTIKYNIVSFENHFKLIYGGAVKESNARQILALDYVDGLLVGGSSLSFDQFYPIIK
jgi:triosephosphate isomerase